MQKVHDSTMQPSTPPDVPRWQDIAETCAGLQQAMDEMIDQHDYASFRPGIARAIAHARDEKQRADHPMPRPPVMSIASEPDRPGCVAVTLTPSDMARILVAARA
jgi:hypothetical protein